MSATIQAERPVLAVFDFDGTLTTRDSSLPFLAFALFALPALANKDWVSEGGHAWMVSGDRKRGYYFIDTWAAPMVRVLDVRYRYRAHVSPQLTETYAIIGRIKPAPRMLVRMLSKNALT